MKLSLCSVMIGMLMALPAASAQEFNPQIYEQMVDASSPETITPGAKITPQNWSKYKNFLPYFVRLGFEWAEPFPCN
jgi:hypothetical protein